MLAFSKARREFDKTLSEGLVFAQPSRLKTMFCRSHLVLMDTNYHTKELNWQLYSLFVRDKCGVYCPVEEHKRR